MLQSIFLFSLFLLFIRASIGSPSFVPRITQGGSVRLLAFFRAPPLSLNSSFLSKISENALFSPSQIGFNGILKLLYSGPPGIDRLALWIPFSFPEVALLSHYVPNPDSEYSRTKFARPIPLIEAKELSPQRFPRAFSSTLVSSYNLTTLLPHLATKPCFFFFFGHPPQFEFLSIISRGPF